jgi:hypothetical protein
MRGQHNLVLIGVLSATVSQVDLSSAGQDAALSTRAASTATPNRQAPQSAGAQPPLTGLAQQEELTGDWGGVRTRWKDKGVLLDSSLTQFYQGVASGGTETGSEYNATAQATLLDEDFFAGGGTERFFNIAQIGPLTVLRQVPLITNPINLIIRPTRSTADTAIVPGVRLRIVF